MQKIHDNEFLERLIIKTALENQQYMALISSVVNPVWFDNSNAGDIFIKLNEYFREYKQLPDKTLLSALTSDSENSKSYLESTTSIDVNVTENFSFILDETEQFIKRSALKFAILDSVDIVNENGDYAKVDKLVKDALSKSIKFDLGSDYWNTLGDRLQRIFTEVKRVIPTYYPTLDEYIAGGFPPKTLNLLLARTHGWKSLNMINQAARQVLNGHNVVFFSCEMSEDMVNQRFDSIFSGLDINRIYLDKKTDLVNILKAEKSKDGKGILLVKEYAPGFASSLVFSSFLREMQFRGTTFDSCYIDYLNLCRTNRVRKSEDSLYSNNKIVAEEIRGLSWEWDFPVISASSFNRGGAKSDFDDVSNEDVGESYGITMTADFALALGYDVDKAIYTNEISWKLIKNRHGGRIGTSDRFFYDPKSLKIYDGTELDLWFKDAIKSGAQERAVNEKSRKPTYKR